MIDGSTSRQMPHQAALIKTSLGRSKRLDRAALLLVAVGVVIGIPLQAHLRARQRLLPAGLVSVDLGHEARVHGLGEDAIEAGASDADGTLTAYDWSFGDGSSASGVKETGENGQAVLDAKQMAHDDGLNILRKLRQVDGENIE